MWFFEVLHLSSCAHNRDTGQTLPYKIAYSDKNTSGIIPKPLDNKKIKDLFDFLIKHQDTF